MKINEIEILTGGNVNDSIEKIGETIYRPQSNEYLHEFLKYMESAGFTGIPRFLGKDDRQREILSFLPGDVVGNRFPNCQAYIWSDDNLVRIARFIRDYHDVSMGFVNQARKLGWQNAMFAKEDQVAICHNDAAPYNFVYQEERFVGMIDFDTAYPAPRLWDLAYTLYTTIPLASFQPCLDQTTRPYLSSDALIRKQRIQLFFEAYQLDIPDDLFTWVEQRLQALCKLILTEAKAGNIAFQRMLEQGEVDYYLNEIKFIKENAKDWR